MGFFSFPPKAASVATADAYADLAADPLPSASGRDDNKDWFSEFADESKTPVRKTGVNWRELTDELRDEATIRRR